MLEGSTFKRKTNGEIVLVVNEDFKNESIYYVIIKPKFIQKIFKEGVHEFHTSYERLNPPETPSRHKKGDGIIVLDDWTANMMGQVLSYTGNIFYGEDSEVHMLFKNHENQTIWLLPEMYVWL